MMRVLSILITLLSINLVVMTTVSAQDSLVVRDVDKMPEFVGGIQGWNKFVSKNINLNEAFDAMDSTMYVTYGNRQTAVVEFIVCQDGEVCEVNISNEDKISPEFAKAVYKLMKKTPKWRPALKDGVAVRTRFRQTVVAVFN